MRKQVPRTEERSVVKPTQNSRGFCVSWWSQCHLPRTSRLFVQLLGSPSQTLGDSKGTPGGAEAHQSVRTTVQDHRRRQKPVSGP